MFFIDFLEGDMIERSFLADINNNAEEMKTKGTAGQPRKGGEHGGKA